MISRSSDAAEAGAPDLPSADELRRLPAEREARKAAEALHHAAEEERRRDALLECMRDGSRFDPAERMRRAAALFRAAVERGHTEVQCFRFPSELCTDRGRAINNGETGWEDTLTGLPRRIFDFWREHLRPRGYKLRAAIVEFPGGMPGDVGFFPSWG